VLKSSIAAFEHGYILSHMRGVSQAGGY